MPSRDSGMKRGSKSSFDVDINTSTPEQSVTETDNRIKRTFKKVVCNRFVPESKTPTLCKCGLVQKDHELGYENGDPDENWNPDDGIFTRKTRTDAFGELQFQGVWTSTRAKYVRVAHDTPESDVLNLLTDTWNLPLPKLLIEVTGGAKDFVLQPKLRRIFREGIVKVAESTDAWILTGGTNTGVMKHVGEALREHTLRSKYKINAIGVVSWGIVDGNIDLKDVGTKHQHVRNYHLTNSLESKGASLDPNHTHFILVDNGTHGKYGVEIPLRSKLEKLVSSREVDPTNKCHIPAVCLVLEGGLNTIRVVIENITKVPVIPVVIADGSGRAADLIAYAYSKSDAEGNILLKCVEILREKIKDTFQLENDPDKCESLYTDLKEAMRNKKLITIYRVDDEVDIDHAILNALMTGSKLLPNDQLTLSLIWNRVDLAKEKLFNRKVELKEYNLEKAMELALVLNRVEFVELLLETGFYMNEFVTNKRLNNLYNSIQNMPQSEPFPTLAVLHKKNNVMLPKPDKDGNRQFEIRNIGQVIQCLMGSGFTCNHTANRSEDIVIHCVPCRYYLGKESTERCDSDSYPFNDLFLWAILTQKFAIARLMWQRGRGTMAKALIGARILNQMASLAKQMYNTDAADKLLEETRWYENLAVDLLSQCFDEDAAYTDELLCAQLNNWSEQTCLSLAASYNHSRFIAHPSIQFLLNDQWYGAFSKISTIKELIEFLFPVAKSKNDALDSVDGHVCFNKDGSVQIKHSKPIENVSKEPTSLGGKSKAQSTSVRESICRKKRNPLKTRNEEEHSDESCLEKIRKLLLAPIVIFWIHTIFYVLFLLMFSFVILIDLQCDDMKIEWAVTCTIFTLATEEFRQVLMMGEHGRLNFWQKIKMWASDKWNLVDLIGIVLYVPGFVLRMCSVAGIISAQDPLARIIFSLDVMVWYIRLLDVCSVNNVIGPYVNMIGKMIHDLVYFILILLVFLVSYGVARQAILSPQSEWKWSILGEIFFLPYWQVYGELFPEDHRISNSSLMFAEQDPQAAGLLGCYIVTCIMVIYLIISNVLLLNLLIAIFNNTFNRLHENASEIWKFERYRLIMEYSQKPFLPPPFTIINHVYMIICWLLSCIQCKKERKRLEDQSIQRLYKFEEECTENYLRQQALMEQSSVKTRIQGISARVDTYGHILDEQQQFLKRLSERMDNQLQSVMRQLRCEESE